MSSRELPEIVASSFGSQPLGVSVRGFPPLSQLTCESGSLALLVDWKGSGRGARCTVSSWRRSCCPGDASYCGGLEERRWGRNQQGGDMADRMTDYFHAHKDATTHDILSRWALEPQAHMRSVLVRKLYCTWCTLRVCVFCAHSPSNCRYYVPAIRNCMVKKSHSLPFAKLWRMPPPWTPILPLGILQWWGRRRRRKRQVSLLLFLVPCPSCFPINNVIIIFTSFELPIRILTHIHVL